MVSLRHNYNWCNLGPPFAPIIQIRDRQSQSRWDALGPETKCGTWTPTGNQGVGGGRPRPGLKRTWSLTAEKGAAGACDM